MVQIWMGKWCNGSFNHFFTLPFFFFFLFYMRCLLSGYQVFLSTHDCNEPLLLLFFMRSCFEVYIDARNCSTSSLLYPQPCILHNSGGTKNSTPCLSSGFCLMRQVYLIILGCYTCGTPSPTAELVLLHTLYVAVRPYVATVQLDKGRLTCKEGSALIQGVGISIRAWE